MHRAAPRASSRLARTRRERRRARHTPASRRTEQLLAMKLSDELVDALEERALRATRLHARCELGGLRLEIEDRRDQRAGVSDADQLRRQRFLRGERFSELDLTRLIETRAVALALL